MLRWLGGCMIVGGSLGLGLWYREQWRLRLQTLRVLEHILELLMSEVRFGRTALPECCHNLAGRLPEPFAECFREIYGELQENTGAAFGTVFVRRMQDCLASFPLTQEDCECFLHFAGGDSFAEGRMQLRIMEQAQENLQSLIEVQERELTSRSRLAVGLGAMSGLLLVIILL